MPDALRLTRLHAHHAYMHDSHAQRAPKSMNNTHTHTRTHTHTHTHHITSHTQRAPNSMNNYGVVLNEVGMRPVFDLILRRYTAGIVVFVSLFPSA